MPHDLESPQTDRQAQRRLTLQAIDRLPLNPGPIAAIMQCPGSDPDELVKVLANCPVLAGRVIGVANSAGSSAVHRMESIERCVRHLGAKQARTVALTMAMQLMMQDVELDAKRLSRLWVNAATKAVAAQLVAQAVMQSDEDPRDEREGLSQHAAAARTAEQVAAAADAAYCVGLLQDIALPILFAIDPGYFENTLCTSSGQTQWTELERQRFGIDHAELAGVLLQQWNAPPGMITQVQRHHDPLTHDDMAWVAEMPARFAGLLPHAEETTTKLQQQTLAATHTRFLAQTHRSIDALMQTIHRRVKAMGKAAGGTATLNQQLIQQITHALAADTFALAAQVSRLDRQLSEQVDALAHTQQDAFSDPLTGLLNRRGFDALGQQMIAQANKAKQPAACLVIDLDDFKPINDTHGHAAGDTILKAAADLLKANVSPSDLVARLGGDEFALLIVGDPQGDSHALAQRIHAICNGRAIPLPSGEKATLRMSIGGIHLEQLTQETTTKSLLDAADQVMYHTKNTGKAGLNFKPVSRTAA